MTIRIPAALAVVLLAGLALVAGFAAGRAQAAPAAAPSQQAQLQLIGETSGTRLWAVEYAGQRCIFASTKGGAGLSLQCWR